MGAADKGKGVHNATSIHLHYIHSSPVDMSLHLHYIFRMKTTALQVRVSPSEKQAFDEAAKLAGISFSSWVRLTLRRAALREFHDAGRRVDFDPPAERVRNAEH